MHRGSTSSSTITHRLQINDPQRRVARVIDIRVPAGLVHCALRLASLYSKSGLDGAPPDHACGRVPIMLGGVREERDKREKKRLEQLIGGVFSVEIMDTWQGGRRTENLNEKFQTEGLFMQKYFAQLPSNESIEKLRHGKGERRGECYSSGSHKSYGRGPVPGAWTDGPLRILQPNGGDLLGRCWPLVWAKGETNVMWRVSCVLVSVGVIVIV